MGYKVLLPQPILESGRAYLLERGYELVDGNGFEEEMRRHDCEDG